MRSKNHSEAISYRRFRVSRASGLTVVPLLILAVFTLPALVQPNSVTRAKVLTPANASQAPSSQPNKARFIYWDNNGPNNGSTIGRANIDGTGVNQLFVTGANNPCFVAVDMNYIYWGNGGGNTVGRANLDGSSPIQNFITSLQYICGVAADSSHIYWTSTNDSLYRANLDGSNPAWFYAASCGVAVDSNYVYGADFNFGGLITRVKLDGTNGKFYWITGLGAPCGVAVDSSYVYWANTIGGVGRANLDGTSPNLNFITGTNHTCGVAVDSSYIYWGNQYSNTIGRANLDGTGVNQSFIAAIGPCGVAVTGEIPPTLRLYLPLLAR